MRIMNSYQKLKAENEKLKRYIEVLLTKPQSEEAYRIKMFHNLNGEVERFIWAGSPLNKGQKFKGLLDQIENYGKA